ncbi:hypothetical protein SAMN05216486_10924 [bacterium JGI 053]|nr:hypothetical protein SAMN05216486_10924 [bacterium JGI 053]
MRPPEAGGNVSGTRFAKGAGSIHTTDHCGRRGREHVPRNPWRARSSLIAAMAAGILAGILMGMLLVHLLLAPNAPRP